MEIMRVKRGTDNGLPVYIQAKDRYTGEVIIGQSAMGKTSLFLYSWQSDHFSPCSKVLVDPTGISAKEAYGISGGNYCSLDHPLSLNPMRANFHPNVISDIIAEAINQVIHATTPNDDFTVKMRGILDRGVKYCLENNRKNLLSVRDYIANLKGDGETRDGILHRLNFFLNDDRMHPIICGDSSFEWNQPKKQSFIFDASGMTTEKMVFVGNLISQGVKNSFRFGKGQRYPLALYIDECHLFVNMNFMDILKEGRKYNWR